jgi:DNA polymerase-3 subunit delta
MAKEKKIIEFANFLEFTDSNPKELPLVLCFVSQDSFEFEALLEFYRSKMVGTGEVFESIVFTGESGEVDSFFNHAFTPDMFYPRKLLIVKSGLQFFKPFFSSNSRKNNELFTNFVHHLPQLSDKVHIVVHYDHWEIPAGVKKLFNNELTLIISKNFYPSETRKQLEILLRKLELHLSVDAMDEFLHRIPPNMGSYMKSLTKLNSYLNKKKFEVEDIRNVLFGRTGTNYQLISSLFFQNRRAEFFKEISKITDIKAELGIILVKLLDRLNELRTYRLFQKKFKGAIPEDELFAVLGMQSYSSGRKYHIKKELVVEARYLKDRSEELLYDSLVQLNLKHKTNSDDSVLSLFIKQKFIIMFSYLEI